jgi:hypothetical protein
MSDNSVKLGEFWIALNQLKIKIDNELIPVAGYLGVDDYELIEAMQNLSDNIENHFNKFELNARPVDVLKKLKPDS